LESKLGEVTGLAMAAKAATTTVTKLARSENEKDLVTKLERMREEAAETQRRCSELAKGFEGKKTAILDEAKETRDKGAKMMEIYLDDESDVLDGFEFLTMAEAGEVGHWRVLQQMASNAGNSDVVQLVAWALPIQERHLEVATRASERLAAAEDPNGNS
jgi:ferritin-like metal-binding protein YciE